MRDQQGGNDNDVGSPARRKGPPAQFFSTSPDEHGRERDSNRERAPAGSWRDSPAVSDVRRKEPLRPIPDRRYNEEDNEARNNGPHKTQQQERRVEPVRAKKPTKTLKQDKAQSEREGRADGGTNGVGQGDDMAERDAGDGEGERPALGGNQDGVEGSFPSSFPSDIRVRDRDREDHSTQSTSNQHQRASSSLVAESDDNELHSNINTHTSAMGQEGTETRPPPSANCRYFSKGHCVFGSKCHFIHAGVGGAKTSPNMSINQERDARDGEDGEGGRGERADKGNRVLPGRGKDRGVGGREGNNSGRGRGGRGPKKQNSGAPGSSNDEVASSMPATASPSVSENVPAPAAPADNSSTAVSHDHVAPSSTAESSL